MLWVSHCCAYTQRPEGGGAMCRTLLESKGKERGGPLPATCSEASAGRGIRVRPQRASRGLPGQAGPEIVQDPQQGLQRRGWRWPLWNLLLSIRTRRL